MTTDSTNGGHIEKNTLLDFSTIGQQDILIFAAGLVLAIFVMVFTRRLLRLSFPYFFMGILGLMVGLWVGSRFGAPFTNLPDPYGRWIPMVINIIIAVAILDLFLAQARPLGKMGLFVSELSKRWIWRLSETSGEGETQQTVVDTSVLIDGRLEAIAQTGFIAGRLIIPQFVLRELQAIADDEDSLRRTRGRRGLEVVGALKRLGTVQLELTDEWLGSTEAVDARLIRVAQKRRAAILTIDFNLNRLAQIQGVRVLNINELATALRPALLPGERLTVNIIQKGKERGQGLGYLPDGTMVVVENGADLVGEIRECEVVRMFQSVAGKMIFVQLATERQLPTVSEGED